MFKIYKNIDVNKKILELKLKSGDTLNYVAGEIWKDKWLNKILEADEIESDKDFIASIIKENGKFILNLKKDAEIICSYNNNTSRETWNSHRIISPRRIKKLNFYFNYNLLQLFNLDPSNKFVNEFKDIKFSFTPNKIEVEGNNNFDLDPDYTLSINGIVKIKYNKICFSKGCFEIFYPNIVETYTQNEQIQIISLGKSILKDFLINNASWSNPNYEYKNDFNSLIYQFCNVQDNDFWLQLKNYNDKVNEKPFSFSNLQLYYKINNQGITGIDFGPLKKENKTVFFQSAENNKYPLFGFMPENFTSSLSTNDIKLESYLYPCATLKKVLGTTKDNIQCQNWLIMKDNIEEKFSYSFYTPISPKNWNDNELDSFNVENFKQSYANDYISYGRSFLKVKDSIYNTTCYSIPYAWSALVRMPLPGLKLPNGPDTAPLNVTLFVDHTKPEHHEASGNRPEWWTINWHFAKMTVTNNYTFPIIVSWWDKKDNWNRKNLKIEPTHSASFQNSKENHMDLKIFLNTTETDNNELDNKENSKELMVLHVNKSKIFNRSNGSLSYSELRIGWIGSGVPGVIYNKKVENGICSFSYLSQDTVPSRCFVLDSNDKKIAESPYLSQDAYENLLKYYPSIAEGSGTAYSISFNISDLTTIDKNDNSFTLRTEWYKEEKKNITVEKTINYKIPIYE